MRKSKYVLETREKDAYNQRQEELKELLSEIKGDI